MTTKEQVKVLSILIGEFGERTFYSYHFEDDAVWRLAGVVTRPTGYRKPKG